MDAATLEARQEAEYSYTIIASLPTGNLAETTYTLDPTRRDLAGLTETSTPLHEFDFSSDVTSQGFEWRMQYVVPADSFPPDALTHARPGERPGWVDHVMDTLLSPRVASASEGSGVQVVVEGVLKEGALEAASELAGSDATTLGDSILNIVDALDKSDWYREKIRQLEKLRRCAENPTNPLTRRMYEENPAEKDRVLREVRRTELEIKSNTAVRFIGAMNAQASGLVRWLGFVVGPVNSWADERAVRYTEEKLRELERMITECDDAIRWTGTVTYTRTERREVLLEGQGTCCGGQPTTFRQEILTEEKGDIRWEIGEDAEVLSESDNYTLLTASYTYDATYNKSELREETAWSSCPGEPRGGTIHVTHNGERMEEGEANGDGDAQASIMISENGSFVIEADIGPQPEGTIHWSEKTRSEGSKCYIGPTPKNESGTSEFLPRWVLATITGTVNPSNPYVLSGSDTKTDDFGDTTVTHEYTWDLQRK